MKVFSGKDYTDMPNPDPGKVYRPEILTQKDEAKDLGGIFGLLPPQTPGMLHYHNKRESILIILSGEGIETVEGKDTTVKAGDVLFIPPGEKHTLANKSNAELRFLEFFTYPPVTADFVPVG